MRHYHVAVSSRNSMVLNESRFTDVQKSVDTFLRMANDFYFHGKGTGKVAITEVALLQYAEQTEEETCIYVDYGTGMRLYWIVCEECRPPAIYN